MLLTQAQREGILAGIVVALFAFGGAWFSLYPSGPEGPALEGWG
jgi:hypothetical protein